MRTARNSVRAVVAANATQSTTQAVRPLAQPPFVTREGSAPHATMMRNACSSRWVAITASLGVVPCAIQEIISGVVQMHQSVRWMPVALPAMTRKIDALPTNTA